MDTLTFCPMARGASGVTGLTDLRKDDHSGSAEKSVITLKITSGGAAIVIVVCTTRLEGWE